MTNSLDLERIATQAARECIRQGVGLGRVACLLQAYNVAYAFSQNPDLFPLTTASLSSLAAIIEPSNRGNFRTTPVTFPDHSVAPPANLVRESITRLIDLLDDHLPSDQIDKWIKDFLDIHPFTDGNGRTAWVLRTWLLNEWAAPSPLPNYYK